MINKDNISILNNIVSRKELSMFNPFFIYIFTFIIILLIYALGWSALFPKISISMILFLIVTSLVSSVFGFIVYKSKKIKYREVKYNKSINKVTILICILYVFDLLHNGNIPIIAILKNTHYYYQDFKGIPTLHIILITFNAFFATYLFNMYISTKNKKVLFNVFISIIPGFLIYSRSLIVVILLNFTFVYLLQFIKISFKKISIIVLTIFAVTYIFGVAGNIRSTDKQNLDAFNSQDILIGGEAKPEFINSKIPKAYFWTYMYIASPLANFQTTVNMDNKKDISIKDFGGFINYEILGDFLGKRLAKVYNLEKKGMFQINPIFNVGTFYASSYMYLLWLGPILMFLFFICFCIIYIKILNKNNIFFTTGLAMLNTVVLLCGFSNIFAFSAISFQLVYPILFSRYKSKIYY